MGLARSAIGAALAVLLLPAAAVAAPTWVTPVAPVSGNVVQFTQPQVASNARGDTAVAWLDTATGTVMVSERPVGGSFSMGAPVDPTGDEVLGSVKLDAAGNIYVFYITNQMTPNASRPWVAVKPIGGSTWVPTGLAPANSADPPQMPIVGAVAPDGKAVAVWFQGHSNDALQSKFAYSSKPAGSSTWAGKQVFAGFMGNAPGIPSLAINSAGEAAVAFVRQFNRVALGATMNTADTWTSLGAVNTSANLSGGLAGEIGVGIDEAGNATVAWSRNDAPPAGTGNNIVQFTTTTAGTAFPTAPHPAPTTSRRPASTPATPRSRLPLTELRPWRGYAAAWWRSAPDRLAAERSPA